MVKVEVGGTYHKLKKERTFAVRFCDTCNSSWQYGFNCTGKKVVFYVSEFKIYGMLHDECPGCRNNIVLKKRKAK